MTKANRPSDTTLDGQILIDKGPESAPASPEEAMAVKVVNNFPFLFLPILAVVGVLCALLIPTLRAWLSGS